jgi:hypothetical protein
MVRRSVQAALLVACALSPAGAQTLRVRLLDEVSSQPLRGALVSAIAANGTTTPAVLSSADGVALVQVPEAGRYRVLVRRIGNRPFTSAELLAGGTVDPIVTLTVPTRPVILATIKVTARGSCDARAESPAPDAEPLWQEVRKALESSLLSRSQMHVITSAVTVDRWVGLDGRQERVDTTARGLTGSRPFRAQTPARLEHEGYVTGASSSGYDFYAPDEVTLLADNFTKLHCVWQTDSVRRDGPATLLGLGFEPRSNIRVGEIQGTIWVDSASSELRRVEFAYVHAPLPVEAKGIGGFVEFCHGASGVWIVCSWVIRMPRWRVSYVDRSVASRSLGIKLGGYAEVGGTATILEETASLPASVPRSISGRLFDSLTTQPLAGAHVHLKEPKRDMFADDSGRFRFDSVGAGVHMVTADYPRFDASSLFVLEAAGDVTAVASANVGLGAPSFATLWTRACAREPSPGRDAAIVFGRVIDVAGVTPDTAATVRATMPSGTRDVHTDTAGNYVACGAAAGGVVSLRAARGSLATAPITVHVGMPHVARRDLSLAADELLGLLWAADSTAEGSPASPSAGGTVGGVVRDGAGSPIGGARVRITHWSGEVRSGTTGAFVARGVPAGARVASVEAIGFERARRLVDVYAGDSAFLDVRLPRLTKLGAVTVRETRADARVKDLEQRQRTGMGYFYDSTAIQKVPHLLDAIHAPGVSIAWDPSTDHWTAFTQKPSLHGSLYQPCTMAMYIDGQLANPDLVTSYSDTKDAIAMIEVYPHAAFLPDYLVSGSMLNMKNECGMVLIWTKAFLRRP